MNIVRNIGMGNLWSKMTRRWIKIRLQPIRVFCLHHVCEHYDATAMYECDWMSKDNFIKRILELQKSGVDFISLSEAYKHISNDRFRWKKYAVLTLDDGKEKKRFNLKRSYYGLLVVPGIWRDLNDFSSGAIIPCLASEHDDAADYIRDYGEFLKHKGVK